ncbi:GIY-YIG catalytic domain protein [Corynebacterium glucuronolyticum ATCC 51867]|nr:GIY-YIG catalytic domain protein [Corynebacterium glucuronolyticum ATCC 51867]
MATMAKKLGENIEVRTAAVKLRGSRFDVRELESIAFILRGEKTLRGLYRLTFADGYRYAGQAINVIRRFAQHRHRWDDITSFEFFPLPTGDLNAAEKLLISETESKYNVRNIRDTRRPLGNDEIEISVEDQIAIALPWERNRRVRPHEQLNSNEAKAFARLYSIGVYSWFREVIGWYLYNAVPDPINTKRHLWTISCLPSTNKTPKGYRLFTLNVGNLEVMIGEVVKHDDGSETYQVTINAEQSDTLEEREDPENNWVIENVEYNLTGVTQLLVTLPALWDAIQHESSIPQLDELLDAAYKLNVRLMRNGSTMFGRFHNDLLASDIIAASLGWQGEDWSSRIEAPTDTDTDADSDTYPDQYIDALLIVQGICAGVCEPKELDLRRNKSYVPILFKNNNRKAVLRLYFNNPDKLRVGVFSTSGEVKMERIESPEDIVTFARSIRSRIRALQ